MKKDSHLDDVIRRYHRLEALRSCPNAPPNEKANAADAIAKLLRRHGLNAEDPRFQSGSASHAERLLFPNTPCGLWESSLCNDIAALNRCHLLQSEDATYVLLGDVDRTERAWAQHVDLVKRTSEASNTAWDARLIRFGDGDVSQGGAWRLSLKTGALYAIHTRIQMALATPANKLRNRRQPACDDDKLFDRVSVTDTLRATEEDDDEDDLSQQSRETRTSKESRVTMTCRTHLALQAAYSLQQVELQPYVA